MNKKAKDDYTEEYLKEQREQNKKRKIKIGFILLGYIVVFILTFIFTGGLEALIQFANESSQAMEDLVRKLIVRIKEALS